MTDNPTGPELFRRSRSELRLAFERGRSSAQEKDTALLSLEFAKVGAIQANTAALVTLGGLFAAAMDLRSADLDAWQKVIPPSPLTECWSRDKRRPECKDRHTEDCPYTDPVPEPEHVLLAVGTRVLVSDWERDDDGVLRLTNPAPGRISGYDMHRTKYRWQREWDEDHYSTHESWAFVDNRVQVHPDGPTHPSTPELVQTEPTAPRFYVRHTKNEQQGYITSASTIDPGRCSITVMWFLAAGLEEKAAALADLDFIRPEDVDRCSNGQTRDECGPGENQCEPCRQAEDEEGDTIERSMGMR